MSHGVLYLCTRTRGPLHSHPPGREQGAPMPAPVRVRVHVFPVFGGTFLRWLNQPFNVCLGCSFAFFQPSSLFCFRSSFTFRQPTSTPFCSVRSRFKTPTLCCYAMSVVLLRWRSQPFGPHCPVGSLCKPSTRNVPRFGFSSVDWLKQRLVSPRNVSSVLLSGPTASIARLPSTTIAIFHTPRG